MASNPKKLILGSRGSKLALWQAERAKKVILTRIKDLDIEIKIVKTTGDIITDTALSKIGEEGLFTKAIETELLAGTIDVGVHSCKDLPTALADGLRVTAYPEREDIREALISKAGNKFKDLKQGAVIGTSSLRRRAFLARIKPDLKFVLLRGNVDTRIKKLRDEGMDAIIMAYAALLRLNRIEMVCDIFDPELLLPAVGQGALALEMRAGDPQEKFLAEVDNAEVRAGVEAERSLLKTLRGGCQIPVGCITKVESGRLHLQAAIANLKGDKYVEGHLRGDLGNAVKIGESLALDLLSRGGAEIMNEIRSLK